MDGSQTAKTENVGLTVSLLFFTVCIYIISLQAISISQTSSVFRKKSPSMSGSSLLPSTSHFTPHLPQLKRPIITARATASASTGLHLLEAKSSLNTLYQVLRIKHNASLLEIKAAYRSLAKQYHPDAAASSDVNGADFIQIHNAYATLSDPIARAKYDVSISASSAYSTSSISRFRRTRTWETDQCW